MSRSLDDPMAGTIPPELPFARHRAWYAALSLSLVVGALFRGWDLGLLSFWYDEVVTMRLARAPSPGALLDLLSRIDATRAPLHPLLLQGWLRIFGDGEAAGRSLSAACGVATIGLVGLIGRRAFDGPTGLLAAWFAAISPPLVAYSREARMYALLVLLTTACWWLLFEQAEGAWLIPRGRRKVARAGYAIGLAAMVYAHPLGMLMAATLGLGSLMFARALFGSPRSWLLVHLAGLAPALPWIPRYFDHPPEFLTGPLPIRSLLGTPIGFLGGNFVVLGAILALIAAGLWRRRDSPFVGGLGAGRWAWPACLGLWLVVPPLLLYGYSRLRNPVFGPSRYTLFVAPAYLVLVAQGLAVLPRVPRIAAALCVWFLVRPALLPLLLDPTLKADWRGFAATVAERLDERPAGRITVVVTSADPSRNVEVETARYYLPPACRVLAFEGDTPEIRRVGDGGETFLTVGVKGDASGPPPPDPPGGRWVPARDFPGLRVYRLEPDRPGDRPPAPAGRGPGASGR
ncbi:glycosyltransferase family 39 protein [Aquisphaera giovannonii]|nr:glycosyltransferase family 39 protein [Aquisphaera giovannonii]